MDQNDNPWFLPAEYADIQAPNPVPHPDSHEHCLSCFNGRCEAPLNVTTCRMTQCIRCYASLHNCKLEEHCENTCPEITVPCLNVENGCGLRFRRKALGKHLEFCPASIVICSVEWNRWPVHSPDKHSPLPFILTNPPGTLDQLDIALALRDQTVLDVARSAPCRLRRMRNELTEKFPAVPLPSARQVPEAILKERGQLQQLSRDASVDSDSQSNLASEEEYSWSDSPWQKRRNPPGLSRSLCSKLYQASRQTTESLKQALQMITESQDHFDENDSFRDLESFTDDIVEEENGFCETNENGILEPFIHTEDLDTASEFDDMTMIYSSPNKTTGIEDAVMSFSDGHVTSGYVPPAPPPHFPICLGVNITVETITRYQTKPKYMLTFVCGQSFRRSEYAAHYKNVHSDIHGGLTWIEQRCPLAQYGCPFSLRRMYPAQPKATIIHSSDLQSFGIAYPPHVASYGGDVCQEDLLSQLPDEVLVRVGRFLDGFALNNLSRVSRRLRSICVALLDRQGLVHQEWIKTGDCRWRIGFQRWIFSTAFEEVHKWDIASGTLGEHLRTCQFFRRVRHSLPVELPIPERKEISPDLLLRMNETARRFARNDDQVVEARVRADAVNLF